MKEKDFIRQNSEKWDSLEKKKTHPKPETLAESFNQITADLSYSRTYYPHRSIKLYLNERASGFFIDIYKTRSSNFKTFINFWKLEIPCIMYLHRKELFITFLIAFLGVGIGLFSFHKDHDFAAHILSPSYIAMTEENIKKGDPLAVYKQGNRFENFFEGFAVHNSMVSFYVFTLGLLGGVGSLLDVLVESTRIATFFAFFASHDLGFTAISSVMMHGTVELSSIVVAGAAGFIMGKGLVFPGNYGRFQSFQMSAKRGMKIILSLIPFFTFAGFIEAYVTPMDKINPIIKICIVSLSALFIIYYFFIYPYSVVKLKEAKKYLEPEKINAVVATKPNKYGILKSDEIYGETITFILNNTGKYLLNAIILASILTGILYYFESQNVVSNMDLGMGNNFTRTSSWTFERIHFLFNHYKNHFVFSYSAFVIGFPIIILKLHNNNLKDSVLNYVYILIITVLFTSIMFIETDYYFYFYCFLGIYSIIIQNIIVDNQNAFSALTLTIKYVKNNFGLFLGVNIVFFLVALIFTGMNFLVLMGVIIYVMGMAVDTTQTSTFQLYLFTTLTYTVALFSCFIIYACNVYIFQTLKEIQEGKVIRKLINKLSPVKKA